MPHNRPGPVTEQPHLVLGEKQCSRLTPARQAGRPARCHPLRLSHESSRRGETQPSCRTTAAEERDSENEMPNRGDSPNLPKRSKRYGWRRPRRGGRRLRKSLCNETSLGVSQPEMAALVLVGQPQVVDTEAIQNRGVQVVNGDRI